MQRAGYVSVRGDNVSELILNHPEDLEGIYQSEGCLSLRFCSRLHKNSDIRG